MQARYKIRVRVIVEPDEDQYYVTAPALPGLHIDGPTRQAALRRTKDGIRAYLDSLKKHGEALPVGPDLIIEKVEDLEMGFTSIGEPSGSTPNEWTGLTWPAMADMPGVR